MTADEYTIRSAQVSDLNRLVDLMLELQDHVEASNPELWRMRQDSRRNLKSQLESRVRAQQSCALVAEHAVKGVIGVAFGRIVVNKRFEPSRAGSIDQAFVGAGHRRKGVGRRLVSELSRFFSEEGVGDISLRYVVGNRHAAGFWEALGFTPRIVTAGANLDRVRDHLPSTSTP